jgi:hypothetical protein
VPRAHRVLIQFCDCGPTTLPFVRPYLQRHYSRRKCTVRPRILTAPSKPTLYNPSRSHSYLTSYTSLYFTHSFNNNHRRITSFFLITHADADLDLKRYPSYPVRIPRLRQNIYTSASIQVPYPLSIPSPFPNPTDKALYTLPPTTH